MTDDTENWKILENPATAQSSGPGEEEEESGQGQMTSPILFFQQSTRGTFQASL